LKIHVKINEMSFYGFDRNSSNKIALSVERKLSRLVKENGFPAKIKNSNINGGNYNLNNNINFGTFNINNNRDPGSIGSSIARHIYEQCRSCSLSSSSSSS
jgi:hypothetical protein